MMEVGDVGVTGSCETHIDCIAGFVINDFWDEVDSIGKLATENHHLIVAVFVSDLDVDIVIF